MNIDELKEAQVRFESNIETIKKSLEELHLIRTSFVKHFTPAQILRMVVDEYVIGLGKPKTRQYNYCYGIERDLNRLGGIKGATAFKFGVYYGRIESDPIYKYRFTKKFGDNLKNAFHEVKQSLLKLLEAGKNEDLEAIIKNKLSPMFKGKILSTYYPEKYLSIFGDTELDYFLEKLQLNSKELLISDVVYKREELIKFKNNDQVMKNWSVDLFYEFLYREYPRAPLKSKTNLDVVDLLKDYRDPIFPSDQMPDFITLNILPPNLTQIPSNKKIHSNSGKPDYEKEARKHKKLGDRGEKIVLELERKFLSKMDRSDLAKKVDRVSLKSDSYGYDIISFDVDGKEKLIEVKATSSKVGTANFFFTANELEAAQENKNYYIYMVYDIMSESPKVWIIPNPFSPENKNIIKTPVNYRITINAN